MFVASRMVSSTAAGMKPTTWTFTYSSYWPAGGIPDQAKLSDGNLSTYFGTEGTESTSVLTADFGSSRLLSWIKFMAAPSSASWGVIYTDGSIIESSVNGTTWTPITTLSGSSETVVNTFTLSSPVFARYVRASKPQIYMGFSEFYFG